VDIFTISAFHSSLKSMHHTSFRAVTYIHLRVNSNVYASGFTVSQLVTSVAVSS